MKQKQTKLLTSSDQLNWMIKTIWRNKQTVLLVTWDKILTVQHIRSLFMKPVPVTSAKEAGSADFLEIMDHVDLIILNPAANRDTNQRALDNARQTKTPVLAITKNIQDAKYLPDMDIYEIKKAKPSLF